MHNITAMCLHYVHYVAYIKQFDLNSSSSIVTFFNNNIVN